MFTKSEKLFLCANLCVSKSFFMVPVHALKLLDRIISFCSQILLVTMQMKWYFSAQQNEVKHSPLPPWASGGGQGRPYPLDFEIWRFPIKFFSKKRAFLSFVQGNRNFTFPHCKNPRLPLVKSTVVPPKNSSQRPCLPLNISCGKAEVVDFTTNSLHAQLQSPASSPLDAPWLWHIWTNERRRYCIERRMWLKRKWSSPTSKPSRLNSGSFFLYASVTTWLFFHLLASESKCFECFQNRPWFSTSLQCVQ